MTRSFSGLFSSKIRPLLSRRQWLLSAAGTVGASLASGLEPLQRAVASKPRRPRSCIVLWMEGGPSQMDTFDLKPGHTNGGPFKEIATSVLGIKISEYLPHVASWMKHMAIIRSMNTCQNDHPQGKFLMHTGYSEQGSLRYPALGALIGRELSQANALLPKFVSIAPTRHYAKDPEVNGPGYLGKMYAPLILGRDAYKVHRNLYEAELKKMPWQLPPSEKTGVTAAGAENRIVLLQDMERTFVRRYPGKSGRNHQATSEQAARFIRTEAWQAFDFTAEPAKVRDAYGRNLFGQGCLMARRLVERGVPFVEVACAGNIVPAQGEPAWDTHFGNFDTVKKLSQVLDPAWSSLMRDLHERGLLETTLIVWMGEFGRSPKINENAGRDHWTSGWSTVLAGGGIRGGQVIGKTSADGTTVEECPVSAADFLATIYLALGMDPRKTNISNTGRPIPLVDHQAQPIRELLA